MKPFNIKNFTEDVEVNWLRDYNVRALNYNSHIFDSVSDFCGDDGVSMKLYNTQDEKDELEISNIIETSIMVNGIMLEYLLYHKDSNLLCGFVYSNDTFGL